MERKEYIDKLSTQLKELDDKIIKMENNAGQVATNLKGEFKNQLSVLNQKKEEVKSKIKELNESNQEAFSVLKDGIANSFNELKGAIESATKKYKSNGSK